MLMHRRTMRAVRRLLGAAALVTLGMVVVVVPNQVAGASTKTVANCNDSGAGSLRQAVADVSAGDTIHFALSPSCGGITLTSGYIEITQNLTIEGPGAGALAVSGNHESTVFVVDAGVTATISGLTIDDAAGGSGIGNEGTLNVTDTTISNNGANGGNHPTGTGAGISNGSGATLKVSGSTFSGNIADEGERSSATEKR